MPQNDNTKKSQRQSKAATKTLKIRVDPATADKILKVIDGKYPAAAELDQIQLIITKN